MRELYRLLFKASSISIVIIIVCVMYLDRSERAEKVNASITTPTAVVIESNVATENAVATESSITVTSESAIVSGSNSTVHIQSE